MMPIRWTTWTLWILHSVPTTTPWEEISDRPSGLDDGEDVGITSETDPTVLSSVKDGVSWTEVTNKPSGFADGVDNEGVTTSSDYGRSWVAADLYEGTSTLTSKYVNATGDTMSGSTSSSMLSVTNNGTGTGVYIHTTGPSACGVYAYATNTGLVANYGGYFLANGTAGRGVYGSDSNTGDGTKRSLRGVRNERRSNPLVSKRLLRSCFPRNDMKSVIWRVFVQTLVSRK